MKGIYPSILFLAICFASCSFFGEKNTVSDYIEKPDYSLKSVEYVPVLPYFGEGITPINLYAGYDELIYAVDSGKAILSFDVAGRQIGRLELPNVYFVIQNRKLELYALARVDTLINNTLNYNLPVIYKISQQTGGDADPNKLDLNSAKIVRKMVYPFCINEPGKLNNKVALEGVQLSSIGFLDDNSYYVTSSGQQETTKELETTLTRRNAILYYSNNDGYRGGGYSEGSASSDYIPIGLSTLVQPPQRARMEARKDYIYTASNEGLAIKVRYVEVVIDPDIGPQINFKPLGIPTAAEASGYLYQPFRFKKPASVLYGGTSQKYIFVADVGTDSVLVFQENGYEGTTPPPQYTNKKLIKVSFGGTGNGPTQFNRPKSIAFFDRVLYVADAGNKRISRFKLTSDYD